MELIITGLFVGILFGFVLQRGRFCMNSAFRDIVLFKDYALIKTVAVALLVSFAGFAIMDLAGVITLAPKPLWWGANILGSFVFGIGMVIAGGCASGVTYRVGEGMVGAMTAVLGLTIGAYVTAIGFLSGFKTSLQESTKIVAADGSSLTLANVLGIDYAVLALGIFVVVVVVWFIVAWKKYEGDSEWGWLTTGFMIGMVAIIAWVKLNELRSAVKLDRMAYYRNRCWRLHRCFDRERIKATGTTSKKTFNYLWRRASNGLRCSALRWL